ncbi:uncharacterized protein LOC126893511 [Daktulosphaira vitifoliae]|uniref:uncharacterized protein LOC126893511 n=1 Tax=Daktulosphaira vitifoliae TaxID=58002 RepID=UPI0021AADB88|nr:uncharacterized protein LOC126893511 [Daktulosphaira vitifoliae]
MGNVIIEILQFCSFIFIFGLVNGEDICSYYDDEDCIDPAVTSNVPFYKNEWAVELSGMSEDEAKSFVEKLGFHYIKRLGNEKNNLFVITSDTVPSEHIMPNQKMIDLLLQHKKVGSVSQKQMTSHVGSSGSFETAENISFQRLDPDTIIIDNGKENLERILSTMTKEEIATIPSRPSSSKNLEDSTKIDNNEEILSSDRSNEVESNSVDTQD